MGMIYLCFYAKATRSLATYSLSKNGDNLAGDPRIVNGIFEKPFDCRFCWD